MIRLPFFNNPTLPGRIFAPGAVFSSTVPKILLTFDDGPVPGVTDKVLSWLTANNLTALFFMVGSQAARYPDLVREVIAQGSGIGNHAFMHTNLKRLPLAEAARQMKQCADTLQQITGTQAAWFRPPYGAANIRIRGAAKAFGMRTVYWSLLTEDYKNDLNIVKFTVSNYLRNNSIVLLHDREPNAPVLLPALGFILNTARERGYTFGNYGECLS